jgi:hypothetical protein
MVQATAASYFPHDFNFHAKLIKAFKMRAPQHPAESHFAKRQRTKMLKGCTADCMDMTWVGLRSDL